MERKQYSVEQIVAALKQAELGMPMADLVRQVGISEQTYYRWKKQYASLESNQVRELKQLQDENAPLKQILSDIDALMRPQAFDPANPEFTMTIASIDYALQVIVLPFLKSRCAYRAQTTNSSSNTGRTRHALASSRARRSRRDSRSPAPIP